MDKPVVLILRGPPGAGKTTTALLLRERLAPATRLSIDTIRYFTYPRPIDERFLRVAKKAAARMAVEYAAAGISSVIDSVFMEVDILNEVCEVLRRANVDYYVFCLHASPEEIERRDASREIFYKQGNERVQDVYRSFAWIGNVLQTQGKVAEEVASEILERLEAARAGKYCDRSPQDSRKICLFLRHGANQVDPARYRSPDDLMLTTEGRSAVGVTGSALAGFGPDRLVTSPFRRCVESASIVGEITGLVPEIEEGLRERHFPSLVGQEYANLQLLHGDDFVRRLLHRSESLDIRNEETIQEAQLRVISTMKRIMAGRGKRVVVVSHGGPYCWMLSSYLGLPLDLSRSTGLATAHFALFTYDASGTFRSFLGSNLDSWDETLLDI